MNFFFNLKDPKENNGDTTIMAVSTSVEEGTPENTLQASMLDQSGDRTLCESQIFNANSISTPFSNSLRKQIPQQNLSCIEIPNTCVSSSLRRNMFILKKINLTFKKNSFVSISGR